MSFRDTFNNFFSYKNTSQGNKFIISDSPNNLPEESQTDIKIFNEYKKNIEYLTVKYNLLINSDISTREFEINIADKKFQACLIFIDGMVDSESINNNILSPLLLKNSIKMQPQKNPKLNNIKKFDLKEFLLNNLIPQNTIQIEETFSNVFEKVNSGFCALFVDTLNIAFCAETKNIQGRSVTEPQNEKVIRGPHAAFIENIRTNTSLIRKIINNENLIIENTNVGEITKTAIAVCYMKNIANDDLVAEVKFRINNLKIDSLVSSGELENLIKDNLNNVYPNVIVTERPDKTSTLLLGRKSCYFSKWFSICCNCSCNFNRLFYFWRRYKFKLFLFKLFKSY